MAQKKLSLKRLQEEIIAREADTLSADFKAFCKEAWPIVEPGTEFIPGMHIDAICEHLQACADREILKLVINIPPRHGKSTFLSVLYPAWVWTWLPTERFLYASYSLALAMRDSVRERRLIKSDWYQQRWPHVQILGDVDTKGAFENTTTGTRQVTSTGGPTTGMGGTQLVLDDPIQVKDAESALVRESTLQWFREAWSTRNNTQDTVRLVIMQRVHQGDVSGYCEEEGGWDHLVLPAEYETKRKPTSLGWTDPRSVQGQMLWPERYSPEELAQLKKTLGVTGTASQLQQRPVPRGGGTFQASYLRFWYDDSRGVPEPVVVTDAKGRPVECPQMPLRQDKIDKHTTLASWDLAFKGGDKNDYVVGQVWASGLGDQRAYRFLLDQDRGHYDMVATLAHIKAQLAKWNQNVTLVEDKANGPAVMAMLKGEVTGFVAVTPEGGKESRASAVAPAWEAGQIWIPHPKQFPWVDDFIAELTMFPKANYDDQVDAMTQAIMRLKASRAVTLVRGVFDNLRKTKDSMWG